MNSQKLLELGQQIIAARRAGADVADLPQQWSDALRKAVTDRSVNGEELGALTDFEYAIHGHPAAEFFATIGTAISEAYERGDTQEANALRKQRADVLREHAAWYHVKNETIHA